MYAHPWQHRAVILEVGQRARMDFTLTVGGLAEAVDVVEPVRLLDTSQAAVGSVIDQSAVSLLPLAIRNWDDLMVLVPGVQGDRFTEESGGTDAGRTGGVNVHGNRSLQNNYLLDGVDNNSITTNFGPGRRACPFPPSRSRLGAEGVRGRER